MVEMRRRACCPSWPKGTVIHVPLAPWTVELSSSFLFQNQIKTSGCPLFVHSFIPSEEISQLPWCSCARLMIHQTNPTLICLSDVVLKHRGNSLGTLLVRSTTMFRTNFSEKAIKKREGREMDKWREQREASRSAPPATFAAPLVGIFFLGWKGEAFVVFCDKDSSLSSFWVPAITFPCPPLSSSLKFPHLFWVPPCCLMLTSLLFQSSPLPMNDLKRPTFIHRWLFLPVSSVLRVKTPQLK